MYVCVYKYIYILYILIWREVYVFACERSCIEIHSKFPGEMDTKSINTNTYACVSVYILYNKKHNNNDTVWLVVYLPL